MAPRLCCGDAGAASALGAGDGQFLCAAVKCSKTFAREKELRAHYHERGVLRFGVPPTRARAEAQMPVVELEEGQLEEHAQSRWPAGDAATAASGAAMVDENEFVLRKVCMSKHQLGCYF